MVATNSKRVCNLLHRVILNIEDEKKKKKKGTEQKRKSEELIRRLMKVAGSTAQQYIPHEIILEILYRLAVHSLIRFSSVSKLWFKSISNDDPHFAASHLLQSQKNPRLVFNVVNYPNLIYHKFFYLEKDGVDLHGPPVSLKFFHRDLVGYCNGLVCLSLLCPTPYLIDIINTSRRELFTISPPTVDGYVQCYGFGFDSLSNEYKVVFILNNIAAAAPDDHDDDDYKCLVLTLGTNSWREITISPQVVPSPLFRATSSESAIFCNGALYWRTTGMLITFDLHDEKFQVIQIPVDCVSVDGQQLVHHLESKGSLCVARLEKLLGSSSSSSDDQQQQQQENNCCKVHLHILKDRINQVWIKETFLLPFSPPLDDKEDTSSRFLGFSDQVLLYWYDRELKSFQLCDLHTKDVKVVKSPGHHYTYYELNNHVENIIPLRTFVPAEARRLDVLPRGLFKQRPRTHGVFTFCSFNTTSAEEECYISD
ncbi:F-box domain [Macleaya cordata]|uniref:F-box domain n=1 Tax=Macleaya cordata TaxID=56857 RepID=A0A200Q1J9_MACCD|nr:F-box domain [Macleaya cordata]